MKRTWLLLVLMLTFVLAMGLAVGCGDDDEEEPGGDTDTDTDTDTDMDASMDAAPEACATVTATVSISGTFAGPAAALIVLPSLTDPSTGAPDMAMMETIMAPALDDGLDYSLSVEVCGFEDGEDYWTSLAAYATAIGNPGPGDATGAVNPMTYSDGGTVALGAVELTVIPEP